MSVVGIRAVGGLVYLGIVTLLEKAMTVSLLGFVG